ncbi:uncharacterized protein O9250_014964 [Rhynochetos jubatus]
MAVSTPLKNTPAAKKMVPPVARSNRVDGRGRGVKGWGKQIQYVTLRTINKYWTSCLDASARSLRNVSKLQEGRRYRRSKKGSKNLHKRFPERLEDLSPLLYTLLLSLFLLTSVARGDHAHQPYKWTLNRWEDQAILRTAVTPGPPSFTIYLCDLVPIKPCLNEIGFYFCPSSNPGKSYCNYPGHYYCAYWGCETVAPDWIPNGGRDPHLKVGWAPFGCKPHKRDSVGGIVTTGNCKSIYINVSTPQDPGWLLGKTWGVRLWEPGTDRGGHLYIKKEPVPNDPEPVGPNSALTDDDKIPTSTLIRNETSKTESENSSTITPHVFHHGK